MSRDNINHEFSFFLKKNIAILMIVILAACGKPSEKKPVEETSGTSPGSITGMVLIQGGTYIMGGRSEESSRDEFPRHEETISSFYMDVTEVTNAQFEKFVEATGYITTAEQDIDWNELKKQVPEGTQNLLIVYLWLVHWCLR